MEEWRKKELLDEINLEQVKVTRDERVVKQLEAKWSEEKKTENPDKKIEL